MKHLILWGSIGAIVVALGLFYMKTSVATKFFEDCYTCPIYANIVFCLLGAYLFGTRFYALIVQIFKQ